MSNWFEKVFGFREGDYDETRSRFHVEEDEEGSITLMTQSEEGSGGPALGSKRAFNVGRFETPSVSDLRVSLNGIPRPECSNGSGERGLTFRHVVGDVSKLHRDPANEGAVFQAASQFNCLEMKSPRVTPEDGITGYVSDRTQGPACALACPAGTLYRNYFVGGNGQGGASGKQLDLLEDVEAVLGKGRWKMENGYALPLSGRSVFALKADIESGKVDAGAAKERLRVGVHWDTEVASEAAGHRGAFHVAQVYCSALPIGYDYSTPKKEYWGPFAQLCLDGAYEASLAVAAILARKGNKRVRVFLTMIGGGVFGNNEEWISGAIKRSLSLFQSEQIDVFLVHYGSVDHYGSLNTHYLKELNPIGVGLKF